jgi:hypothetical protein
MNKEKKFNKVLNQTRVGRHKEDKECTMIKTEIISEKEAAKMKHNRSAKYTDEEDELLKKMMVAYGTDQVSKVLRWMLHKTWEQYGDQIEEIYEKKRKIDTL